MSADDLSQSNNNAYNNDTPSISMNEIKSRLDKINILYPNKAQSKKEINISLSSPSTNINLISSIIKTNSNHPIDNVSIFQEKDEMEICKSNDHKDNNNNNKKNNNLQFLNHKRKLKKINKKRNEILIQIIDCPLNFDVSQNYAYLTKESHDKHDCYSLYNTKIKNDLIEKMLNNDKIKHKIKGKNKSISKDENKDKDKEKEKELEEYELSFGDTPSKIYHDYLIRGMAKEASEINKAMAHLAVFPSTIQCSFPLYYVTNTQKNYKKFINNNYVNNLKKIDKSTNEESIIIRPQVSNRNNNNNNHINNEDKIYKCTFCPGIFASPQGLGGHMSRTHSEQSMKFQKKKEIRTIREPQRKLLEQSKIILCNRHDKDFTFLHKTKQGKEIIKRLVNSNKKEYKNIRKELLFANNVKKNELIKE